LAKKKSNKDKKATSQHRTAQNKAKNENDLYRDEPLYPNQKLCFILPIAPSVNHMYITTRRGGRRLTDSAKEYNLQSIASIQAAIDDQNWLKEKQHVWFYIDVCIYMPDRRRRDTHNMYKILLDVIQHATNQDDYYYQVRQQKTEFDSSNPRIEVSMKPQLPIDRERNYN